MDTQPSALSSLVEGMSQILHPTDIADFRLVEVYFQMEFLFDELGQAFTYALRTPLAFAEDQAVICVTHEWMTAAFQLLVQFVEHNIAQQRAEWAALRRSLRCRLIYSVNHHASIKVFMYQAYDPAVLYGV